MKALLARIGNNLAKIRSGGRVGYLFNNPDGVTSIDGLGGRPYARSVWVQRAIKHVAGPISAVPVDFTTETKGGKTQGYDDPALSAYWKRPGVGMDWADVVKASVGWHKLAGEFFWLMGDDSLVPFPDVRDLSRAGKIIVARPDRMNHICEGGELIGWLFTAPGGKRFRLLPEQVIHRKEWNPYDDWRGLSEYEAASMAAESDQLTAAFVRNLMRGNGDRGPYIISKTPLKTTDPQREQILADLRAKRLATARGEHRPLFLTGDFTIKDPEIAEIDEALLAMRLQSKTEIFVAFGVPPSFAEPTASYSIGSASDRFKLIEETCMPEGKILCGAIDEVTLRLTGKPLHAVLDWDENSTMQQVRGERIDQLTKVAALGMPVKEANDYLRLGMKPFPGWDQGYLPFSVQPVDTLPPEKDPALSETPPALPEGAVENMLELLARRRAAKAVPICRVTKQIETKEDDDPWTTFTKARDPKEAAEWRMQVGKMGPSQKRYKAAIDRQLLSARAEMLQKIEAKYHPAQKAIVKAAGVESLMFDLKHFTVELFTKFERAARQSMQSGADNLLTEIGRSNAFTLAHGEVLDFIKDRENKLADTPQAIFDQVKGAIEAGVDAGDSRDTLAGKVKAAFNGISDGRARTIATTEANTAYSEGRNKAMKGSGIKFKRWLTSNNDNVRETHQEANGQVVALSEPFIVGGEELQHPHDPNGSPGEVINCHCVMIPEMKAPEADE